MSSIGTLAGSPADRREPSVAGREPRPLALFSLRSLRVRLVLTVLLMELVAAAVTYGTIIYMARQATELEIASSMQLGETLVTDTIRLLRDASAPVVLKSIDLHFQSLRHVRIAVVDAAGHPVEAHFAPQIQATQDAMTPDAPAWFLAMIAPPIERKDFPIVVRGEKVGTVTIRSEPADEISEAWTYARALLISSGFLYLAMLGALFVLFGRSLRPLTALGSALKKIENNDYAVRLPQASLLELATITDLFNSAAEALCASKAANRNLNRKLLTAQDDERRRTALELHDEVGPCLFALEANATSVTMLARKTADPALVERADDVVALIGRVRSVNRRMLDRLRPMALGQIPLSESLARLLIDYGADSPVIESNVGELRQTYGKLVDLTVYRCFQEGLFNAVRHANARKITVTLEESRQGAHRSVALTIADDGRGLRHPLREGRGLSGMRERVEALAGSFTIAAGPDGGTTLAITIPLETRDDSCPDESA